jgi:methyl-accepting chemotaxis protein
LSALSATSGTVGGSRAVAAALIVAFLVLAFAFSALASRALQGRLRDFLQAARRLGSGDLSLPIKVEGRDEFAALAQEFNSMSAQLSRRLDELSRERAATGGHPSHRSHLRLEPRSPCASGVGAEDRG